MPDAGSVSDVALHPVGAGPPPPLPPSPPATLREKLPVVFGE